MARKSPRKWSTLAGTLPDAPVELTPRELAVRAAMDRRATLDRPKLAAEYARLKQDEANAAVLDAMRSIEIDALERLVRVELQRIETETGQDTWRAEGWLFTPKTSVCPIVKDRAALMAYIKEQQLDNLLSLHGDTLKSLVSGVLEAFAAMTPTERADSSLDPQHPLPGVEVYLRPGINHTKQVKS